MTEERRIELREALQRIEDQHGRITPDLVVTAAKNPKSVLHAEFEWDVHKAAQQHWIDKARDLIRSIIVTVQVEDKAVQVNYYVRDPERDAHEQGYRSIMSIRKEPEPSRILLLHEFAQAEANLERAEKIALVVGHIKEVKKALSTTQRMRERITTAAVQSP